MAFTALKTEREDNINFNRMIRTRARKKIDLYPEFHPVHWVNQPLNPGTGVEEPYSDWDINCLNGAITGALHLLHTSKIPSHIQFCFRGIWEKGRIALVRAFPRANMVPSLTSIMQLNDPMEYLFLVHRMYDTRTTLSAEEAARELSMPEYHPLASTRSQIASPNQLSEYRVALGATGKLEVACYLYANQVAQHFKAAVDNAFLGPADQLISYPAHITVPTPEEIVAVADTAVDSAYQPEYNPRLALLELDATLPPASLLLHRPCPSPL